MLLAVSVTPQPTEDTCGPTCLESIYRFYGRDVSLDQLRSEVSMLQAGGTLSVNLGCHALANGFDVEIYSYNLQVFDPTWFALSNKELVKKLMQQTSRKSSDQKLSEASQSYIRFLKAGGAIRFSDLAPQLIKDYLGAGNPIIAALSSTYLYQTARENPLTTEDDDIGGYPAGHFVVVSGFDEYSQYVTINDPFRRNPFSKGEESYQVDFGHFMASILLGVVTYDANLMIVSPREAKT
jgi:hypothetical protein